VHGYPNIRTLALSGLVHLLPVALADGFNRKPPVPVELLLHILEILQVKKPPKSHQTHPND